MYIRRQDNKWLLSFVLDSKSRNVCGFDTDDALAMGFSLRQSDLQFVMWRAWTANMQDGGTDQSMVSRLLNW